MEDIHLAYDVVKQIAPFMGQLLAKYPMASDADPHEKQAYALWKVIYPKVALRSKVILAAKKLVEDDSSNNRVSLSNQLALVFRTNSFLAAEVKEELYTWRRDTSTAERSRQEAPPIPTPRVGALHEEYSAEQISCQVCNGQDETLRLISYPFVFSLVIITFRRMFHGVYCSRHANRYFFLATLITMTVGWMGIPFGLIFTPVTLFNLYNSDKRLRPANAKLLLEIAKAKQEKGHTREAAVFYQESLWLNGKESRQVDSSPDLPALVVFDKPEFLVQVFSLLGGFSAAWLLGFLIGLIDGMISTPFVDLQGQISVLVIIFSYIPLLLMLFFGGFVLARFVRWMLERTLITSHWVGRMVAGFTSLISFYAILVGNLFFFVQAGSGQMAESLMDYIRINGLLLVHGGWLTLNGLIRQGNAADLLFVVLVIFGWMSFFWLSRDWAQQTVQWRRTLQKIERGEALNSGALVGVSAVLIVGIIVLILGLIFYPSTILLT